MNAKGSTIHWFHVGVIAPPNYNPAGFEQHVAAMLAKLLGLKSHTHKIGIYFPWAEPVGHAVTAGAVENRWVAAGQAIDRMGGDAGWIRCWSQIAAASQALVVFGPTTPAMEVVLDLCARIDCRVRQPDSSRRGVRGRPEPPARG